MRKLFSPIYEYEVDGKVWKFTAPKVKAVARFQEAHAANPTWENIGDFAAKLLKRHHRGITPEKVLETFSVPVLNEILTDIVSGNIEIVSPEEAGKN